MNWLIFWIVIYLVLIIVLALRHLRTSDFDQYLVNNRNTKLIPLVFTMLATFVGGGTSIGLMAMGYESGFAAIGIGIAYEIGFMIMMRFAGKIRTYGAKNNIYSYPHFLNHKYTSAEEAGFSRLFSATVSGVNIFIFFFILCAQFVAMASLLKFSFELGYTTAAIISAIIIIEVDFNWPGIGSWFFWSMLTMDYPVTQACFIVLSMIAILTTLCFDIVSIYSKKKHEHYNFTHVWR